jgi:NADH dehydrogenase
MKLQSVLVVGGSGFVGRHLAAALARYAVRIVVPTRSAERAKHLTTLPTIEVVPADVFQPGELERLASGCQMVVNLAGILHGRRGRADERGPNDYGPDFARTHVELPQAIVRACRAAGVKRLLHMSALGASPSAPSEYLRSKGIGEQAVLAADDLEVTVFRPSVIFGPEDRFLNRFARLARWLPLLAIPSPESVFKPVYVADVAAAMLASVHDAATWGKAYELCGPREYSLRQLVEYVGAVTGHRRPVFGLPQGLARFQARFFELLPEPPFTRDNLLSMSVPSTCTGQFPFGLSPQSVDGIVPSYLSPSGLPRERYLQLRWRARR